MPRAKHTEPKAAPDEARGAVAKPVRGFARADPKVLFLAEKRSMAFELRLAGWMPEEIATHLGLSEPDVEKMLLQYATQVKEKDARHALELREVELARIDAMFAAIYPNAIQGQVESIATACKLIELRAKITGSMENQPLIQQQFTVSFLGDEPEGQAARATDTNQAIDTEGRPAQDGAHTVEPATPSGPVTTH